MTIGETKGQTSGMERFAIGTGRCGSTLLSTMLAEHREVISINEFFTGLDWTKRFEPGEVTAGELVELISAQNPVTTDLLARGYDAPEIQYPFSARSRFGRGEEIPWLLVTMVPRLTDEPDDLFDEMIDFASARGTAPLAEHYLELFEWLTQRADGSIWIERSGSSIDYLGELIDLYPEAKFLHIHRDGKEAALSMRAHPFYRLGVALLYGLLPEVDEGEDEVVALVEHLPPVESFGRYWTEQLARGFRAVHRLEPEQYLAIRFEDLIEHPEDTVSEVAGFFDLPADAGFASRAAALVQGRPSPRFPELPATERKALAAACRAGEILLGRLDR